MSYQDWLKNGWLRPHQTSQQEIAALLAVVERDLKASADPNLHGDWRFAIAYNAALQCAALALKADGYEVPKGGGAHFHTIGSLKLTLEDDGTIVDPLQAFRAKRGGGIYEATGVASDTEITELRSLAERLRERVMDWLKSRHPPLVPAIGGQGSVAGKGRTPSRPRKSK